MKTLLKLLYLFLVYTINIYAQVITVNGIKLPSGSDATQHQADELAIGGPSSDFATLTFPFAGATTCTSASPVPTTINQEIDTYGKTILLVTSPSDCPYCRNAAFSVNNAIIARLPNIRLWYAASKLAGATSDCDEITNQKADIPFLANAHFTFMDAYWWDNTMQRAHHNASGSSYLMAPELPSSYRIIDPITRKVTSLGYYLDENALDAAIAKNFTPGGSITVNPSTLNFAASASGLNFSITGNGAWTISDNAAWLTVSSTTGTGNRTVIANVAANLNTVSRNATISIVGSNVTRIISVSQAGATPIFMLTPQTLNYAATGSLLNISLTSNMSWSASGAPAWVSLSTLSGIGSAVVGVNAGTNLGVNIRTGSITFSAGSSSLIVNITQTGAMPQLTVNPTSVNPPQAGNSTTISVTSNINWSVSENATWLSTSVTNGNGNNTFNAVASANATIFSRSETITVSGSGINRTIVVSQAGLTPSLIVSPTSLAYSAGASVQNVTVTSNLPTWTVAKSETWITLNVNSGSNNGNINVSALENTSVSSRTASVTVSGNSLVTIITITQNGAAESLLVNPSSLSYNSTAELKSSTITSNVNWTLATNDVWLSISTNSGVAGIRNINISAATNANIIPRVGQITISGGSLKQFINIGQNAASAVLTVNPATISFSESSSSQNISISTNSSWILSTSGTWLTLGAANGMGNATPSVTASANTATSARSALIIVSVPGSSQYVTVNQAAAAATLTTSPTSLNIFPSNGGSQAINLSSNSSWTISSNQPWLSVSTASGTGNASISVSAAANMLTTPKFAQITFNYSTGLSQTLFVTVAGANPTLSVSPNILAYAAASQSQQMTISSNTNWGINNPNTWINISALSGALNQVLDVEASSNPSTSPRFGTITITAASLKQIVSITQSGANFTLSVSASNLQVNAAGGTNDVLIISNTSWNISENASWISFSNTSGSNDATVQVSSSSNNYFMPRSATITVSGGGIRKEIIVTQAGESPSLTIDNNAIVFISNPTTSQNINIISNLDWVVSNTNTWVNISTLSGTLNGAVTISLTQNSSTSNRNGTITISGSGITRVVTINQNAVAQFIELSSNSVNINSLAGTATFTVSSNVSWTAAVLPNWVTLAATSGSLTQQIEFSYLQNLDSRYRTAVVTVLGNNQSLQFTINQNAGMPTLQVDKTALSVSSTAANTIINVVSNLEWYVFEDLSWVSVSTSRGLNDGSFAINVSQNSTTQSRMGNVTVSGLGVIRVIKVSQQGASQSLNIPTSVVTLTSEISSEIINLSSNTFWTITGVPTWLTIDPISGSGDKTIIITPTENNASQIRTVTLTITGQDGFKTIVIEQKGKISTSITRPNNSVVKNYIFPNPVLLGENVTVISDLSFEVYNLLGIKISMDNSTHSIKTDQLLSGIYIVKFDNGEIHKLIVR